MSTRGSGRKPGRHGQPNGRQDPPKDRRMTDDSVTVPCTLFGRREFRPDPCLAQLDMQQFVQSLGQAKHVDQVLMGLAKEVNLTKLTQILQVQLDVGRGTTNTFELLIMPLVRFLMDPRVQKTPCVSCLREIYRRVALEPLFFRRVMKCLENHGAEMTCHLEAVQLFIELLLQLCYKVPNVIESDNSFYRMAVRLVALVDDASAGVDLSSRARNQLDNLVKTTWEFLPKEEQERMEEQDEVMTMERYRVHAGAPFRATRGAYEAYMNANLGPRHDNDGVDYKRIMILPTDLEIRSREEPFMPLYPDSGSPLSTLLDFHFRGLREDLIAQLKRGIQWFLGGEGLSQYYHQRKKLSPPRSENVPSLLVCNEVKFETLSCHYRKGVSLEVSAAQPFEPEVSTLRAHRPQKQWNNAERKDFWARDRLTVGSLIALAVGIDKKQILPPGSDPLETGEEEGDEYPRLMDLNCTSIFFGTVSDRNEYDLVSSNRLKINLKFERDDFVSVLNSIRGPTEDCLLIEASRLCFPPTQAVLKTLQKIEHENPPLLDQLFTVNESNFRSTPRVFEGVIERWNLQHLVRKEFQRHGHLSSVLVTTFEDLCAQLTAYEQRGMLVLDGSQVEAFTAALTRSSCLIQGPPGTGKSYVGTRIVETFLKQSSWQHWAPIVCVCYTNHALDQFLEGLVSSGACSLGEIVRVGGRSKSETIQTRNLTNLRFSQLNSREEQQAIGRIVAKCKSKEEESWLKELRSGDGGDKSNFFDWLQDFFPEEYDEIVSSSVSKQDHDGFKDNLGKTPSSRWKSWCKGRQLPGVSMHPNVVHTAYNSDETAASPLLNRGSMWNLQREDRQFLKRYWGERYHEYTAQLLSKEVGEYDDCVEAFREVVTAQSLRILRQAKVVGITTTGCAQNQEMMRALDPKIVICEEAGEVLEAHLLACITSGTQQLIQIGDHLQLRPMVNEYKLSAESRQGCNLDISLFERMVTDRSKCYRGNIELMRERGALVTLQTQRRMRPTVADLVRFTLYPKLEDAPSVSEYPDVRGFRDNVWFLDHDHPENSDEVSYSNRFEAEFIVALIQYAVKQGYGVSEKEGVDDIAVLTPYLGQLRLIRRLLRDRSIRVALDERDEEQLQRLDDDDDNDEKPIVEASMRKLDQMVKLSTVDNFQGNEATLVLISTVRCNDSGRSGFLKTSNRVNVMLSRAKHGMIILGSAKTIRKGGRAEMFIKVLDMLESRQMMGPDLLLECQNHGTQTRVASAKDLVVKAPDGGCSLPCNARLPCGHACPRLCHPDDLVHSAVRCLEPCNRIIDGCGHLCVRRCHEKCVCDFVVSETLRPCGHVLKNVRCRDLSRALNAPCNQPALVSMPLCKHEVSLKCSIARKSMGQRLQNWELPSLIAFSVRCSHVCGGIREDCEHTCKKSCGKCLQAAVTEDPPRTIEQLVARSVQPRDVHDGACDQACGRVISCGHYCEGVCHRAEKCPPCQKPCENICVHSKCKMTCKEPCASCSEPCQWLCKHTESNCPLPCGSPCIRLPCDERCEFILEGCGHQCPGLCGERCLPSSYCRECGDAAAHGDDVVDMLMLAQLKNHDPDESPLIKLECGHAFTVETLDHFIGLSDYYSRDDSTGKWKCAKPLQRGEKGLASTLQCPACRAPVIGGIQRYGRVLHYLQARNSELKFHQKVNSIVVELSDTRHKLVQEFAHAASSDKMRTFAGKVVALSVRSRKSLRLVSPTVELMMKEISWLRRLGLEQENLNLAAYREVTAKYSLLQLRLEYIEVVSLTFHTLASLENQDDLERIYQIKSEKPVEERAEMIFQRFKQRFNQALHFEHELLQLCEATRSHDSNWKALVGGVRLRALYHLALRQSDGVQELEAGAAEIARSKDECTRKYDLLQTYPAFEQREHAMEVKQLKEMVKRCLQPEVFYQTVTTNEKQAILRAFGSTNAARGMFGGFGGRWYECPNGHPYMVTECGGVMQTWTCPECKEQIGGQDHRIVTSNRDATQFFQGAL